MENCVEQKPSMMPSQNNPARPAQKGDRCKSDASKDVALMG